MGELVSARFFSHWQVVQALFLDLCMHFFYSPSCCIIFLTVKALQELFSQIFHPSSLLKDQMVHPLLQVSFIVSCTAGFIKQEIKLM